MNASEQQERKPRADVQRNRAALLETAQRHFLRHGVGTSLEAVAKDAGVGPGTLYRHFPTREALLAAVLQTRSEKLETRQADIEQLSDAGEALEQWLRAMEEYFSAFSGLPDPLMAAARAQDPDNPLTIPCDIFITATDKHVKAAQNAGHVRASVRGYDLFLAACSIAWIKGNGADEESLDRLRTLLASGYRERDEKA
ncbi:TetR/AcrR family transcriptional regulator [Nocardia rhizosphaerihabitans]|uniref:TetR family transcriptional regulator n=1 Tax=Nocardia rhizosphaerihabitans TaxID=1691570 RepID=A0ABQ2L4B6_9NOCA|nr:TetR/AcrR family transcriptional regulator [Nocardia rhizosphaerihabitans]GGN99577.1 TetR family transcriptional regulator [Nocardia rhizosphaerihabitans]